ncbi:MAG: membrane protein [Candidatus Ozemobacter sibiricus]|jgi:predicted RND superfamily exporter protein|uniref:Membrane protein n=1 Tax=Candidatus Ozemobacter sibiricus TaxID=2268124 RepID=A0A367ZRI0_9BACT|nr:MAG: membrane protein [Candidatus Ozemobacter sibiricus]
MALIEWLAGLCQEIADRFARPIGLVLIFLFLTIGPGVFPLRINNTLATLLEEGTAEEATDRAIKATFGDLDEVVILVYHHPDLFTPAHLAVVKEMTEKIAAIDGVRDVFSLASTPFFRTVREGDETVLHTAPLLDTIPTAPAALARLRDDALGNRLYVKNIISPDGQTAALNIIFAPATDPFRKEAIVREIRRLMREQKRPPGGRFELTGMHVFMEFTGTTMVRDVELFSVLSLGVLFLALLFLFRSVAMAGIGLLTALVANGLLFISLHLLGRDLSISTTPVPAITMGLTLAYALHFLVAKHEGTLDDPHEVQEMFVGAFFSGLTSVVGFLSLCLNAIPTLQDFGLYAAIGTFFAGWSALFVTYPLLKLVRHRPHPRFARRFKFLLRFATARYRGLILSVAVLFLLAGGLILRMEVETDYYQYYLSSSPMTRAVDFVNRTIGGQYPIVVELDAGGADRVLDPAVLGFLERFKAEFEPVAGVDKVITWLDLLEEAVRAFDDRPPAGWYADAAKVAQAALVVQDASPALNGYYVSPNRDKTLLFVRTSHINSARFRAIHRGIEAFLAREAPPGLAWKVGGTYLRCVVSADRMAVSQFEGTFWEIIVLFSSAWFIIRSVRLTVIAFLANLLPIFGVYGLLSLLGETLNMGTTMIAAVSLGIGVDDTIHYVVRYLAAYRKHGKVVASTKEVIRSTGVSMFLAASMIAVAFLTLSFSTIKPIFQLGVYTVVTMALCFAANMLLVPVLITWWMGRE